MALVNQAKREINAKIVFFGPGEAGKASNLKLIYNKLKPDFRGALKAMNVQQGRMLFFDFTPPGDGNVEGFRVRFHVYTVSGGEVDPAAWKMVLKGADGIVFVADAQSHRQAANRESLETLANYLKVYGQSLSSVPLVLQFNKTDMPDCLEQAELERTLNPAGVPCFRASTQTGDGVLQTLLGLVKNILAGLRGKGVEGIGGEALQRMVEPGPRPAAGPEGAAQEPERSTAAPAPEQPAPVAAPPAPEPATAAVFQTPPSPEETPAGFGTAGAPAPEEEPLSLDISGAPQPAGEGRFRLPLTIRSGARTKDVVLTVAVSLEED